MWRAAGIADADDMDSGAQLPASVAAKARWRHYILRAALRTMRFAQRGIGWCGEAQDDHRLRVGFIAETLGTCRQAITLGLCGSEVRDCVRSCVAASTPFQRPLRPAI